MSDLKDVFFVENIVKVNKKVANILLGATLIVPTSFILLTFLHVLILSHLYSISLLSFGAITSAVCLILNKKGIAQKFVMYFGLISCIIFVGFLGSYGAVKIRISYAFAPVISLLYYDRKFTRFTNIINYILILVVTLIESFNIDTVVTGTTAQNLWIIQSVIGYTIEAAFLLVITTAIAKRLQNTLSKLVQSMSDRDTAFQQLQVKNNDIIKVMTELEAKNEELSQTQFKIIQFIAQCLGSHDLFTGRHVIHTQRYVEIICRELKDEGFYVDELSEKNIHLFQEAAFLHDIGKIHIPEGILNKIGKFTPQEFDFMKSHALEGKKLLEYLPPIENGYFNQIAEDMAYTHHEKWDGSGYPQGLSKFDIPLCGRIMAAADVLDALISQRLYKDPMSIDEALEIFKKSAGIHFEPCIAQAVCRCKSLIELIDNDFKTTEAVSNAEELEWWQQYHENLNKIQQ